MNKIDQMYDLNAAIFAQRYIGYTKEILNGIDTEAVSEFIALLLRVRQNSGSVYFIGNGGSASTASHFANDLSIGTNSFKKPLRALSLNDNMSIVTAIANDYGYSEIFVKQLQVLAKPNDMLVAISASGNSSNLIKAIEYANDNKIFTVGLTAFDGGLMKSICKLNIHIPTNIKEYGPAEDMHMLLDHLIGAYLKIYFSNES